MNERTLANVDVSMQDTKGRWMVWWVMKWNDSHCTPWPSQPLLFQNIQYTDPGLACCIVLLTYLILFFFFSNMSPIVVSQTSIFCSDGIATLAASKVLKAESSQSRGALPPICPSNGKKGRQKTTVVLTLSNATPTQSLPFPDSHTPPWHIIYYCRKCDH